MKKKKRRQFEKRWRKRKDRGFPSPTVIHNYLKLFHDEKQEHQRVEHQAFIPQPNAALQSLLKVNRGLIEFSQKQNPVKTATLDQDATLSATHKKSAQYCYEKYKAYQPLNTYWYEQDLVLHSEFRDGSVPAGFEQLRVLKEALELLPDDIEEVYLRSDSAGYQQALLEYCAEGKNPRVKEIKFAISSRVSIGFKAAVAELNERHWQPIYKSTDTGERIKTNQEWSEVCFVPNWASHSKKNPHYRYLAIREKMTEQLGLDGIERADEKLPFPTQCMNNCRYKLFGLVTNMKMPGNDLINWHRKRCGKS